MAKDKIPVYEIGNLRTERYQREFLIERFASYLQRQAPSLHHPHRHGFFHLVYFSRGAGTQTVDFTTYPVKPGLVYFMVPGQVHSWHFEGDVDGYIINFSESFFRSFLLNPAYFDRFSFFNGGSADGVCQLLGETREKAAGLFEELIELSNTPLNTSTDLIKVLLLQLFFVIEEASGAGRKQAILPRQKQLLLTNLRRLIELHYRAIRLPKEYAELLYITPNHLNALCQDLLGKSAGELIRERVLLEAKRLLTNADMTVTEIAYELTFRDNSYFTRFFKKAEGMTPEEFRKKYITFR